MSGKRLVRAIMVAREDDKPMIIRAETLEHLLKLMREAVDPDLQFLNEEFVTKTDFRNWLVYTGRALPVFRLSAGERSPGKH